MGPKANPLPGQLSSRIPFLWTDGAPKAEFSSLHSEPAIPAVDGVAKPVTEDTEILHASIKTGSIAQVVVAVIAVVGLLYLLKFVMVTILLALLIALVLEPIVQQLTRISVPRPAGAFIAIFLTAALTIGTGYALLGQVRHFASELPTYSASIHHIIQSIQEPLAKLDRGTRAVLPHSPEDKQPVPVVIQDGNVFSHLLMANGAALKEALLACGFIPFLTYFMLTWKEHTHAATVKLFPEENRAVAHRTLARISAMIRSFLVGNLIVAAIGSVLCVTVFWLLNIPYFYLLGILSGFANLVPSFGFFLALLPPLAGGIGILSKTGILIVVLTIAATHSLMLNFLYPKLIGKRVRLNPLAVVISLLFWLWIWGGMGLILAVPIVGAAKIICDYTDSLRGFGEWLGE